MAQVQKPSPEQQVIRAHKEALPQILAALGFEDKLIKQVMSALNSKSQSDIATLMPKIQERLPLGVKPRLLKEAFFALHEFFTLETKESLRVAGRLAFSLSPESACVREPQCVANQWNFQSNGSTPYNQAHSQNSADQNSHTLLAIFSDFVSDLVAAKPELISIYQKAKSTMKGSDSVKDDLTKLKAFALSTPELADLWKRAESMVGIWDAPDKSSLFTTATIHNTIIHKMQDEERFSKASEDSEREKSKFN